MKLNLTSSENFIVHTMPEGSDEEKDIDLCPACAKEVLGDG